MSGIFGWIAARADDSDSTLASMAARTRTAHDDVALSDKGPAHGIGACGARTTAALFHRDGCSVVMLGHPRWREPSGAGASRMDEVASHLLAAFAERGAGALDHLGGDYALAIVAPGSRHALIAVDRMSVRNVVYAEIAGGLVFGSTCDVVSAHPEARCELDLQGIYNYLHFHMVPGPGTVYRGQRRVLPGHYVEFKNGRCSGGQHWRPRFVENDRTEFGARRRVFRAALETAVDSSAGNEPCGAFLSGGTDSSTISGLLGRVRQTPARTFSIGFEAEGFDEMQYARIAARHFGATHHEYYVTPQDVVDAVPRIAAFYDQPFGNASAVPTYYCARLAKNAGISRMLGGDGGDELFGGNARYAKQLQFAYYDRIHAGIRNTLIEPLAMRLPFTAGVPILRKAKSYVAQASLPMPERYDSYNLLERLDPVNVLEPAFLSEVDRSGPIRLMREVYRASDAQSLINRMLAFDFQFTLADSDLPKVTRMCEMAGVDIAFPMLSEDVIDFSLRLAPDEKLRGTRLRPFFKDALNDFLPPQILTKEKHGFGLPVGTWLQSFAPLRTLAQDSLSALRKRRIVRPDFIDRLLDRHLAEHAEYFGTMVWILMMLELWFARDVTPQMTRAPFQTDVAS